MCVSVPGQPWSWSLLPAAGRRATRSNFRLEEFTYDAGEIRLTRPGPQGRRGAGRRRCPRRGMPGGRSRAWRSCRSARTPAAPSTAHRPRGGPVPLPSATRRRKPHACRAEAVEVMCRLKSAVCPALAAASPMPPERVRRPHSAQPGWPLAASAAIVCHAAVSREDPGLQGTTGGATRAQQVSGLSGFAAAGVRGPLAVTMVVSG